MARTTIDRLIINSPYEVPARHWRYERETRTFDLVEGRRPAGYVVASGDSKAFDDPGVFVEIPLVNQVRPRVKAWREAGYPGITSITNRLLEHWRDPEEFERRRFFFCQLEAVETLIWLTEAPAAERVGIEILGDGGAFLRRCCKMATGSGKTIVMAMVIAWQILNKVTNAQDARFSKNVLVVAPGLTVKSRLGVLEPAGSGNYYEAFHIVPSALLEKLRQGKVLVRNWHALAWDTETQIQKRRSVDKRGAKSDEAYTREVLGEMANARNFVVLNDEAHHAWRINWEAEGKNLRRSDLKDSAAETTVSIGGLDRLHRSRGILACYDFSATPFAPSGKKSSAWQGSREVLLAQLVRIVEQFICSDRIRITPPLFYQDELRRRLIITLNMTRVVQHVWEAVRQENTEKLTPVFDSDHPIRTTGNMATWYTGRPCERTRKSHINVCVYDSTWEASDAFLLDDCDAVAAWAKNDHLGFEVLYVYRGVVRKYRPDFLVRLKNGAMLVLETKGSASEQDRVKQRYLEEWAQAVSAHGGFGCWRALVAETPGEVRDLLMKARG